MGHSLFGVFPIPQCHPSFAAMGVPFISTSGTTTPNVCRMSAVVDEGGGGGQGGKRWSHLSPANVTIC